MTKVEAPKRATIFSISLASGLFLFLTVQGLFHSFVSASSFQVEEMEASWPEPLKRPIERYRLLPTPSIFQVDLQSVAQALEKRHPTAEVERIQRILPNRVKAFLRPKPVVAQVRAGNRYYPITEGGTVLSIGQPQPWPHLPIFFLAEAQGSFRVGQTLRYPGFPQASELLKAVHRQGGIAGHSLSSLRLKGQEIVLFLDSGLEIRFNRDRLLDGWRQLGELLAQRREILQEARYLDLRFEDPVIGAPQKGKGRR